MAHRRGPFTLRVLGAAAVAAFVFVLTGCDSSPPVSAAQAAAPTALPKFEIVEARIADIQGAIKTHQLTTTELLDAYLARIKAYNGTCVKEPNGMLGRIETIPNAGQINALSTLNLRPAARAKWGFDGRKARSMTDSADADPAMPDAYEVAAALDKHFAATGALVGPLHGVVMAIKDQYDTYDMRTTSGGDAFWANDRPPDDATFIAKLRAAGAIILAKSNLAEYASGGPRSAFGGTFCNPYDTERSPNASSAGSGTAVAANLVTCAIAEETSSSIRGPAVANNAVGIAPTQELVSRDGMIGAGLNTRVGPICRTVEDAAKILSVIAGYDPKDEMTAFGVGRLPAERYETFAGTKRLDGMRIGVLREYMDPALGDAARESTAIVEREAAHLRELGAEVVDPGAGGKLFGSCVAAYAPMLLNAEYAEHYSKLMEGKDQIEAFVDLALSPDKAPADLTIRSFGNARFDGEGKYSMNRYLHERGDANIKSNADLIAKANFYDDDRFPDRKAARQQAEDQKTLDSAGRLRVRFAMQQMVLQCMQLQNLDALTYPTSATPPTRLDAPGNGNGGGRGRAGGAGGAFARDTSAGGSGGGGVWSFLGQQGFPTITVPAGFTTEVYDRVLDPSAPKTEDGRPGTKLAGPTPAKLPVGIDFLARPFAEPVLIKIGSAYEGATHHRTPPEGYGDVEVPALEAPQSGG
ncbi:MAG TPA: amidase [Gammaproteobacteria bacterium]|nr:amidase [Gammaproteobacteria bacterium]